MSGVIKSAIAGVPPQGPSPGRNGRKGSSRLRGRGLIAFVALAALGLAAGLGSTLGAKADTVNNQDFCLQGDVSNPGNASVVTCAQGQRDWTDFFGPTGNKLPLPTGTNGSFTDSTFQNDTPPDSTTYATGSKDSLQIGGGGWQCSGGTGDVGSAKTDLDNTYAAVERLNSDGHIILYYGAEILSSNGDHNQGMWLLQDPNVGCSTTVKTAQDFNGSHVDGDLLFAVALTGGGSKPFSASTVAFKWACTNDPVTKVCSTTNPGSLVPVNSGNPIGSICGAIAAAEACAISNETWNVTTPWPPHNAPATVLGPQQFFEGGIDVSEVFGGNAPCFNRFVTNTRSSQSPTATLFDYTQANLQTCATPTVNTQLKVQSGGSQANTDSNVPNTGVPLGSKLYDTSTLSGSVIGTPGGTVTYKLFANNDCTGAVPSSAINGTTLGSDGTINDIVSGPSTVTGTTMPNSSTLTFTSAGHTYYWVAYYSGDGINLKNNSGCAAEPLTINKVTPALGTADSLVSPPAGTTTSTLIVGTTYTVSDTLTFTGTVVGVFPASSSTVSFTLYSNATCTTAVTGVTATVNPSGSSDTVSSGNLSFTPSATGTYTWGVSFSGDSNYNKVPSSGVQCGNVNANDQETLTVVPASPALVTQIALEDKVTISGIVAGGTPTATVTFQLWDTVDCTGTSTDVIAEWDGVQIGSGGVASTLSPGTGSTFTGTNYVVSGKTYSWKVTYSGDSLNNGKTVGCSTANGDQENAAITYTR